MTEKKNHGNVISAAKKPRGGRVSDEEDKIHRMTRIEGTRLTGDAYQQVGGAAELEVKWRRRFSALRPKMTRAL